MDFYLYSDDQISLGCFQAFHCDAIMGQILYQFQGNQRDYFSNNTFRGRSLVSSAVYYEVTPPDTFPLRHIFGGVTPNFGVALQMYTRRIVILKRVEDLQLEVESYHKKLNITRPEIFRSDISNMTPYTVYKNPLGIIYVDKHIRNRLMRTDELYKFGDGTLTSVRAVLHDISSSMRMDYLPKHRWSNLDRKRSRIMIKKIDQTLFEKRMIRNLEKFVGGRAYGEHLRLLQRTI
ncbi:hypothetical protein Tco_0513775 [Tanacetum coccineum]